MRLFRYKIFSCAENAQNLIYAKIFARKFTRRKKRITVDTLDSMWISFSVQIYIIYITVQFMYVYKNIVWYSTNIYLDNPVSAKSHWQTELGLNFYQLLQL